MRTEEPTAWVVYTILAVGKMPSINAICTQGEWSSLDSARPGKLALIREQIDNEGEAERLARTLQPPAPPKPVKPMRVPVRPIPGLPNSEIGGTSEPIPDSQLAES